MFGYRHAILDHCETLMQGRGAGLRALDFGSGDGWFAEAFQQRGLAEEVVALDVRRAPRARVETMVYDGGALPFGDRAFDLVYAIDVLHHCDDPAESLRELMRCASGYVLLKDHVHGTRAGFAMLCAMDEIGNRLAGVPCPYRYQKDWSWRPVLEAGGFVQDGLVHPARCHPLLPRFLSDDLQFVGLWRRVEG